MKDIYFRNAVLGLIIMGILLLIIKLFHGGIGDPDTWWHLAAGQYIVENGTIPKQDIFSWTLAGQPWITHEWLPEVFFYLAYLAGQFLGMLALVLVLTVALLVFYWRLLTLAQGSFVITALTLLIVGELMYPFLQIRPQVLSYLFFVVFLYVLYLYVQEKRNYLFVLPVVSILWANSHGSFPLGPALIFLFIVCGLPRLDGARITTYRLEAVQFKALALVFVLCIVATVVNPNGLKLLVYPLDTVGDSLMMDNIQEWLSPDFHKLYAKLFLAYFLATFLVLVFTSRRIQLTDLVLFLVFSSGAFIYGRFIAYALLVSGLLWPRNFHPALDFRLDLARLKLVSVPLVLALYVLVFALKAPPQTSIDYRFANEERYPVNALEYLETNPLNGRMFNQYGWGGYLIWNRPAERVFIDGRADVYMEQVFGDYLRISQLKPEAAALLEDYRMDYVLMPADSALVQALKLSPRWAIHYEDGTAAILVKRE